MSLWAKGFETPHPSHPSLLDKKIYSQLHLPVLSNLYLPKHLLIMSFPQIISMSPYPSYLTFRVLNLWRHLQFRITSSNESISLEAQWYFAPTRPTVKLSAALCAGHSTGFVSWPGKGPKKNGKDADAGEEVVIIVLCMCENLKSPQCRPAWCYFIIFRTLMCSRDMYWQ